MLVEAGFILSILLALRKGRRGEVTPEREAAYLEGLENCRGPNAPAVLRRSAAVFRKHGFPLWATMYEKRADYLAAPETEQEKRREVVRLAMRSFNPDKLEAFAAWFEAQTATGVARDMRARARAIRAGEIAQEPPKANTAERGESFTTDEESKKAQDKSADDKAAE